MALVRLAHCTLGVSHYSLSVLAGRSRMLRVCARRLLCTSSTGSHKSGNFDPDKVIRVTEGNSIKRVWKILRDDVTKLPGQSVADIKVPYETDIVIIGGGIMGSAIAYWLKQRNPKGFTCTVVEQDPKYTQASTVLSVGGIRQQFSSPENIQMSMFSADFLRNIRKHLSVLDSDPPDIQFNPQGYLFLASEAGVQTLQENHTIQKEHGAKVVLLNESQLKSKWPWLHTDGVVMGSYGVENEGWFDPWSLLSAFKKKAMSLGVQYIKGEVVGFEFEKIEGAMLAETDEPYMKSKNVLIKADDDNVYPLQFAICVNACGHNAGSVAKMAGVGAHKTHSVLKVGLPVEPRKRYVYMVHAPTGPGLDCPVLIDSSGSYLRREGLAGNYLMGASPASDDEPDTSELTVDYDFFNNRVWPEIAHRCPDFEELKLKSAWAGYYDYNTLDQNVIIGPHPVHGNFIFANGFSGHGIQQAAAVGRAVMEVLFDGGYKTIDLTRFGFERVIDNRPQFEKCVV
ncbi:PREDICTED: FAD-dependent oxidoreductase domain-containing protein 1-like [Priapulus caudatus]|uniref:FAD-dependent oxidoreductase domain-containing protein 1 n=1 Tax=Priapulus caudatus TaxID=37621 RepID=A0ABM1EKR0_PRICU|nr:PREDICTED: FAD-dependent oxidoreductase domain-containing protein 1-like [Priapulus caudatus]